MLKAIVMDFDGVIADSEPLHYRAFLEVARRFGVEFTYPQYLMHYVGLDDRDGFRAMLAASTRPRSVIDGSLIDRLCEEKFVAFASLVEQGAALVPGAKGFIERAAQELPLAIASGATDQDIRLILEPLGMLKYFSPIVTADDVYRSKPHPQTYALAVEGLAAREVGAEIRAESCLAIEDTGAGLASAKGAGLRTLALTTTSPEEELTCADRVLGTLADVTVDQLRTIFDR